MLTDPPALVRDASKDASTTDLKSMLGRCNGLLMFLLPGPLLVSQDIPDLIKILVSRLHRDP
jgi:hypothetical protein